MNELSNFAQNVLSSLTDTIIISDSPTDDDLLSLEEFFSEFNMELSGLQEAYLEILRGELENVIPYNNIVMGKVIDASDMFKKMQEHNIKQRIGESK